MTGLLSRHGQKQERDGLHRKWAMNIDGMFFSEQAEEH